MSLSTKFSTLEYLTDVPWGTHLVLFYDDERSAYLFSIWYLTQGLVKGEDAVYVTHGDEYDVRSRLKKSYLDVDYYENVRKSLHIQNVRDPSSHPDGFEEGMREMYSQIFSGVQGPVRVVGPSVPFLETEEEIRLNLAVESNTMAAFHGLTQDTSPYRIFRKFQGSVMCNYKIRERTSKDWMKENAAHHHAVISATAEDRGVILNDKAPILEILR